MSNKAAEDTKNLAAYRLVCCHANGQGLVYKNGIDYLKLAKMLNYTIFDVLQTEKTNFKLMEAIGKTTTGKEVFDVARPGAYKGWTPEEHKEASKLHMDAMKNLPLGSPEENAHFGIGKLHLKVWTDHLKNRQKNADWKNEFRKADTDDTGSGVLHGVQPD